MGARYSTPRPDTCIATSCNPLSISTTILNPFSLSPYYDSNLGSKGVEPTVVSDYRASERYRTVRLLQHRGSVINVYCTLSSVYFPHKSFTRPPVSLSPLLPPIAFLTPLWSLLCCPTCTPCRRRTSTFPLSGSLIPIRSECRRNSSGFRPDLATTFSIDRRARPDLTALTALTHRYAGRAAWSGKQGKYFINFNTTAMPSALKDYFGPRTSFRVRKRALPCCAWSPLCPLNCPCQPRQPVPIARTQIVCRWRKTATLPKLGSRQDAPPPNRCRTFRLIWSPRRTSGLNPTTKPLPKGTTRI